MGLIKRPFDPARRRFYLVSGDVRHSSPYDILNEKELDAASAPGWWASPQHRIKEYWGKDVEGKDKYYVLYYGVPKITIKPRIKIGTRGPVMDVYNYGKLSFVSTRIKDILQEIDPGGFEFAECEAFTKHRVQLEPYWLMAVSRVVREFDEDNSVFREMGGRNPDPVPGNLGVGINQLYELRMNQDFSKDIHAFYLLKYSTYFIFDEVIVDRFRAEKIRALNFSPLQPQTKQEENQNHYAYDNADYFEETRRYRWQDLVEGR